MKRFVFYLMLASFLVASSVFAATPQGPVLGPSNASIQWLNPTTNTDGSALTDLATYQIFISTTPGSFTTPYATLTVINPAPTTAATVTYDLRGYTGGDGQRWTTVKAVDIAGNPSANAVPDPTAGGSVANGAPFIFDSVKPNAATGLKPGPSAP